MTLVKPAGTSQALKDCSAKDTSEVRKEDFEIISNLRPFLIGAKLLFEKTWESKDVPRGDMNDFEWHRTIGKGAFGRVVLAKHNPTNVYCAVKVLCKAMIVKTKQLQRTYYEMKVLTALKFRFLVHMLYVMKDNSYLYFAMPFAIGGEMYGHLQKLGRFSDDQAKFYAVQVCLGLEYLHFLGILHRDIKPENILIDQCGYLKITDMGFCKIVKARTYTFCGTPEYLAPEIILNKGYGKAVDWWSYGVLLYEMRVGHTPFYAHNVMKTFEKITDGKYKDSFYISKHLKDLISHILQVDPTKRYGNLKNGVNDIKDHKWFKNINWIGILNYKVTAPYLPKYTSEEDTANFSDYAEAPFIVAEKDLYASEFDYF